MLKDIVTSDVRVKVLHEFFSFPWEPVHVRELTRRVGTEINAVRRDLFRLHKAGILRRESSGNRVYYSVRKDYRFFADLVSVVEKEKGLSSKIVARKSDLGKITFGLISYSFVLGRKASKDDVDLLIVGAIDVAVLEEIVSEYQEKIGYEINYTVMGEDEFKYRKSRLDPFIIKILTQTGIIFIGKSDEYCKIPS